VHELIWGKRNSSHRAYCIILQRLSDCLSLLGCLSWTPWPCFRPFSCFMLHTGCLVNLFMFSYLCFPKLIFKCWVFKISFYMAISLTKKRGNLVCIPSLEVISCRGRQVCVKMISSPEVLVCLKSSEQPSAV